MPSYRDIEQARRESLKRLQRAVTLREYIRQENRVLHKAAGGLHDRMNDQILALREKIPSLHGKEKRDAEQAYLLACERRGTAAQARGALKVLRQTLRPLR